MSKKVTYVVEVVTVVELEVDVSKFDNDFKKQYAKCISPEPMTIDDHVERLAGVVAASNGHLPEFIEGYGKSKDFGLRVITAHIATSDIEHSEPS